MPANNAQKKPFAASLEKWSQQRAFDAWVLTGKALPCSLAAVNGPLVKVNFELVAPPFTLPQITVPVWGPEYIRYPYQVGDKGGVVPFDVLMGPITGMGGNTANLGMPPSNLGGLVFTGLGNKNWSVAADANKIEMYGPNGFFIHDTAKNCTITGDSADMVLVAKTSLTLQVGSKSIVINSSGITIDGILWDTHYHGGVQTGGGNTGGPA